MNWTASLYCTGGVDTVAVVAGAGQDMLTELDRLEQHTTVTHRKCGKFQINTTRQEKEKMKQFFSFQVLGISRD